MMFLVRHIIAILILLLTASFAFGQIVNKEVKAEIKVIERDNYIDIVGIAHNNTDVYINTSFMFKTIKKEKTK